MNLNLDPSSQYTLIDSTIIIHCDVNETIEIYGDIYEQLIFSNYTNIQICIETGNKYCDKYYDYFKWSKFNQPINLTNNIQLTQLIFGHCYNQLINLENNIQLI